MHNGFLSTHNKNNRDAVSNSRSKASEKQKGDNFNSRRG